MCDRGRDHIEWSFAHNVLDAKPRSSLYEWSKLICTHYLTGPLLKTVKLHSLIVLREEWAYTVFGIGTMDK